MLSRRTSRLLTAAGLVLLLAAAAPAALATPTASETFGLAQLSDWILGLFSENHEDSSGNRTSAQEGLLTSYPDDPVEAPAPFPIQSSQPAGGEGESLPTNDPDG